MSAIDSKSLIARQLAHSNLRKRPLMNKKNVIPIIVTIFLFALSPVALIGASAVSAPSHNVTQAPKVPNLSGLNLAAMTGAERAKLLSPNANGKQPVGISNAGKTNPLGNTKCPAGKKCTVVADGIGGVQVFEDGTTPTLLASVFIPTNSSNPYTCPEGVVALSSSEVLISDACLGDYSLPGFWVFNPYTLTFSTTQWTNVGSDAYFGIVFKGDVFFENFGPGTVTVVTTSDTYVTTITTSGYYPEFFAATKSAVYVSERLCYDSSTDEYADCIQSMTSSGITGTIYTDQANGIEYDGYGYDVLTGIAIVGTTITANCEACDNSTVLAYGGVWFTTTSLASWSSGWVSTPDMYILWGSGWSSTEAYPISVYNYNQTSFVFSEIGFVTPISASHAVGTPLNLGALPEFACPSGLSGYGGEYPNYYGGTSSADASILSQIKAPHVSNVDYYGATYGYGCGST